MRRAGTGVPEPSRIRRYLNVTTSQVCQLKLGATPPIGVALALLNVIRREGIEVVL